MKGLFTTFKPRVVNIHTTQEPFILIDRSTIWGNKYKIGVDGTREQVIAKYEKDLKCDKVLMSLLPTLRGHNLGCHCKPKACHGDVLLRLANRRNK